MALHRWSLICQAVNTDSANNLNLTGVLDEIHLSDVQREKVEAGEAGVLLDLHVVSVWHRDQWEKPEELEIRLVYCDPQNGSLGETGALPVNLRQYPVVRVVASLLMFPLRGYGVYRIRVEKRRPGAPDWEPAGGDITIGIWEAPVGTVSGPPAPSGPAPGATTARANIG